jgi:hypothetical protein
MDNDNLKRALLERAPELAEDYKRFVRATFKSMQEALGPGLAGAGSNWTWARTFGAIRGNLYKDADKEAYRSSPVSMGEYSKIPYKINEETLERNAQQYGERVALEWYNKMRDKLGDLERIVVADAGKGGDIVIKGWHKGRGVSILQQRIINVSSKGLPFHQFPSRIYVDGKFLSESAYKRLVHGASSSLSKSATSATRSPTASSSIRRLR